MPCPLPFPPRVAGRVYIYAALPPNPITHPPFVFSYRSPPSLLSTTLAAYHRRPPPALLQNLVFSHYGTLFPAPHDLILYRNPLHRRTVYSTCFSRCSDRLFTQSGWADLVTIRLCCPTLWSPPLKRTSWSPEKERFVFVTSPAVAPFPPSSLSLCMLMNLDHHV